MAFLVGRLKGQDKSSNSNSNNEKEQSGVVNEDLDEARDAANENNQEEAINNPIGNDTKIVEDNKEVINVKGYLVSKAVYSSGNISIKYPVVSGLGDVEETANNIIYTKVMLMAGYYIEPINPTIELSYTIKKLDSNILSIVYEGYGSDEGLAYPINFFYTTNIDLNTGTALSLSDLAVVDDDFIVALKIAPTLNNNNIPNYFNSLSDEDILYKLNNSDQQDAEVSSYICEDGTIGISVQVNHAMGDHLEYQVN